MANKVWRGFLNVGALSVPVHLCVAARDEKVELKSFHTVCKGPLSKPYCCNACDVINVPKEEIFKGYDAGTGIVPLTETEMDEITPLTEKVMEISECVKWEEVDSLFLAESFYLLPEPAGAKAYSLLTKALSDTGRVAVVQISKSRREHVAILRPKGAGLVMHYLWYSNEIARVPEFENLKMAMLSANEVKAGINLVENLTTDFAPEQYSNGYIQRLNTLISSKLDKTIAAPAPVKSPTVTATVDLMSALTASIGAVKARRHIKVEDEKPKTKGKKSKAA